ncbi:Transcriptional regulatory protein TcrA [Pelotomaculum schinkii]|uniref:Stage 0 sporulation protein A homolog n=1 Tax=Pelotomaculum schinkii TaxID=78350 RepID=A0A4Y7RI72_9FIRM|nr:response regulator [Pelotomaculum schinkii]TEB08501.1 Transcriptional regulatory protein TcrA [Pelotomaculum schinkii]
MARVLIMEDEPNIAFVLKIAMSEEGHEVRTCQDGLCGLQQLEKGPLPDIVLVDLCMPRVSGRAVVETMHKNQKFQEIPVVIMSGSIPDSRNFPPANSYRTLITKPFDLFKVVEIVNELTTSQCLAVS